MLKPEHLEILEARALDVETLLRHGVKSSERFGADWIEIPYLKRGEIVNNKYRTIGGKKAFQQDAGAMKIFWNRDVLDDESLKSMPVVICEGEFDALAAIQCGYLRTVSVPDGAPPQEIGNKETVKYSFLEEATAALADCKEIILATDSDGPGGALLGDLALRLGKTRCKWVKYPVGCKDLNDVLVNEGHAGVVNCLSSAQWVKVDGVYLMSELPPAVSRMIAPLRMPVLDNHYRPRLGDFVVITGIPSHGKSSFLNEIAARMANNYGWVTAFASFEQEPQTDHWRNLRTYHAGKRQMLMTDMEKMSADKWIDDHFCFICPNEDDEVSLDWVLEKASAAAVRFGAKLIIIDPWNEMDHVRPRDMTMTEYTGFAIKQFKKFAKKHQVHLIVAAHPAKQQRLEKGGFAIPSLYDISDSAHWYNKPDAGLVVWRGNKDGRDITIIRIAKSRYHEQIGVPGDIEVTFSIEDNHYTVTDMG